MTATTVTLPDGSEQDATTVICKGCEMPMSDHSCGGASVTITSGATAAPSRSTGPRKKPSERPPCPHCNGAVHFSMPGGLQNIECVMRQWYMDTGVIAEPNARLPIYGPADVAEAQKWIETLATPISYGRMESAAGGAGTYAALRPKAEPKEGGRKKKVKPAEEGERIEDLTGEIEDFEATTTDEEPAKKSKKSRKNKVAISTTEDQSIGDAVQELAEADASEFQAAESEPVVVDEAAEKAKRRAERRAILAGSR